LIFTKNEVYGKEKTRLAATIGKEQMLFVYKKLIGHTISVTRTLPADKIVYFSDSIIETRKWDELVYQKRLQSGHNLGERMKNAFKSSFTVGYKKVILISPGDEIVIGVPTYSNPAKPTIGFLLKLPFANIRPWNE
jgi:glycosyltransferase A (GT-A) superfamily protein (DUF2064 family)